MKSFEGKVIFKNIFMLGYGRFGKEGSLGGVYEVNLFLNLKKRGERNKY